LVTPALESDVVIVGHAVVAAYAKSFVKESPGEVVANKAARSGNKYSLHFGTVLVGLERCRPQPKSC
jgi:hypothetical protein